MSSSAAAASSSSAVRRPRLRVVEDVDVGMGVGAVGAAVFALRCLLVDCFALALFLVLFLAVVWDEEEGGGGGGWGGSEPTVAVVEILLNEEYVDPSLLVDSMVAIVEVLRSPDGLGLMLDGGVEVEMVSSILAIAYVLRSRCGLGGSSKLATAYVLRSGGLGRAESAVEEVVPVVVGTRAAGICLGVSDELAPAGMPCTPDELPVPVSGLDEEDATRMPRGLPPCSMRLYLGGINSLSQLLNSRRPTPPMDGATTPSYTAVPGLVCSSRPCLARQRGALRPKRGIEACIGSSFFAPLFMEGWSGKSWSVRGTPI